MLTRAAHRPAERSCGQPDRHRRCPPTARSSPSPRPAQHRRRSRSSTWPPARSRRWTWPGGPVRSDIGSATAAGAGRCPGPPTGRSRSSSGPSRRHHAGPAAGHQLPGRQPAGATAGWCWSGPAPASGPPNDRPDRQRAAHPGRIQDRHRDRHVTKHPLTAVMSFTEYSARTGRVVRPAGHLDAARPAAGSTQDVLWTNSSGSTLIVVDRQPGLNARPGHRRQRGRLAPGISVLTPEQFVPISRAPSARSPQRWPAWSVRPAGPTARPGRCRGPAGPRGRVSSRPGARPGRPRCRRCRSAPASSSPAPGPSPRRR